MTLFGKVNISKKLGTWISILVGVTILVGIVFQLDHRWYQAEAVEDLVVAASKISKRLDQKILGDQASYLQKRMWKLEDRYRGDMGKLNENSRDREQYREMKTQRETILRKIDALDKSMSP